MAHPISDPESEWDSGGGSGLVVGFGDTLGGRWGWGLLFLLPGESKY